MTETKTYKITTSSRFHFIFTIIILPIICMIPTMVLVEKLELSNENLYSFFTYIVVGIYFIGGWKLLKITSKAALEIQIIETGLKIKWEKNYFLYKYPDRIIKWEELDWYKFTPDLYFDIFKIRIRGKRNFKFEHDSDEKDDFRSFYAAFRRNIRERNNSLQASQNIKEAPNIYEGLTGKILMGLSYLFIVSGAILIPLSIIKEQQIKLSTIFGLLAGIAGGVFTIIQVKNKQKKNKK